MRQLQRVIIQPEQVNQALINLTPEQWHYLSRVLRLGAGDRFIAVVAGQWWEAELSAGAQASCLRSVPIQTELPRSVVLMAAPPKGNGFDEVIRQATELGVTQIVPVLSDRTLLQPSTSRQERWQRIATEAAEQSQRQRVPALEPPQLLLTALGLPQRWQDGPYQRFIAVTDRMAPLLWTYPLKHAQPSIVILTGPEGGWTPLEVEAAMQQGYQPVSLGPRILRAVTAPLVALSLIAARLECSQTNGVQESADD